jgi:hypothetical protein
MKGRTKDGGDGRGSAGILCSPPTLLHFAKYSLKLAAFGPVNLVNGNFSKLTEILEKDSIQSNISKGFSIDELIGPENFVSLLFYFGLLTISGIIPSNKAILKIPNETVKRLYYDFIKETYQETGAFSLDLEKFSASMDDMAFNGQWQPLIEYLAHRMNESLVLRDLMTREKAIQVFLNVYLGLSDIYIIHPEKEMNKGFADLALEPFLAQYPAIKYSYLIELKYIKPSGQKNDVSRDQVKKLREEAENQLKQYSIDEKYSKTLGQTQLVKLVLIFCGHRLVYHGEVEG